VKSMRTALPPALIVIALVGAWEAAARWELLANALAIKPFLVPAPTDIAQAMWEHRGRLAYNGWVTLQEVVLGFAIAVAVGGYFAVSLHRWPALRRAFYPLLVGSQTVPIIVIAPILVVWLGYGIGPKLAVIALICFFPITVNTLDGLRSVDPDLVRMMRTLDASRWQILRRVEAPTALPYLFSGAKIAVAVALIAAVFAEWVGATAGLGHMIRVSYSQLLTAQTFAAVVVLAVFAVTLFGALSLLERRVAWWGEDNGAAS
jgi:putative hydroxymethylpyrimidine transport system permease protein